MSLVGAGYNNNYAIGVPSDPKLVDGHGIVSNMTEIPVDAKNISCVAAGWLHTVIATKDGHVLAAGNDTEFRIGSENRKIYEEFTEIKICDELIVWAAAGDKFTLYLTESGRVILCHKEAIGERINVSLTKRAVSVFGGYGYGAIIDVEGSVYLLDEKNPHSVPEKFSFPSPAIEVVCCLSFCAVLLSDNSVYGNGELNGKKREFCLVPSLRDQKIKKISGYSYTCLALNEEGVVFAYGSNNYGQLGDGTTTDNRESFKVISSLSGKRVKDIACSAHSLFLTEDDELYGCGWNKCSQLFKPTDEENVLNPNLISQGRNFSSIFVGNVHSLALCGVSIDNPARMIFSQTLNFNDFMIHRDIKHLIQQNDENNKLIKQEIVNSSIEMKQEILKQNQEMKQEIVKMNEVIKHQNEEMKKMRLCFEQTTKQIIEVTNQNKDLKNLLKHYVEISGLDQW